MAATYEKPATRELGRTGFEVTPLGLGGQASLQWTPPGESPEQIILKALSMGITYFDTSNIYGPSQLNYGRAFRDAHLIPGRPGYDERKRRSFFLASKTGCRFAKGPSADRGNVYSVTEGPPGSMAIDDVRRSLSQIFGDGQGGYPPGAYLDLVQIHNLVSFDEVDAIYEGLSSPDPKAEWIGALAALRDYRDGTNRTGLNPEEEKLIRHIGITGHYSSPVLMECLQRDTHNVIDTLLVAINANDRRYFNHQFNVIPVAASKNVGVIGMKVFSDGAMYGKKNRFSYKPDDVVRAVGTPELPSTPLVRYSVATPGISTVIIGIGHIDKDHDRDQLEQNMAAAHLGQMDETERREIEEMAMRAKEGMTNYYQLESNVLGAPRLPELFQEAEGDRRKVHISWQTAYAGARPVSHYEIMKDDYQRAGFGPSDPTFRVGRVDHHPQATTAPFVFEDTVEDRTAHRYRIVSVDVSGNRADSGELFLPAVDGD